MLIEDLSSLGTRAFQTQYEVVFPEGIPFGSNMDGDQIKIMQRREFQLPARDVDVTEWSYRGMKITDAIGMDATTKEFELEFVIDQAWGIYKDFSAWRTAVYDDKTGVIGDRASTSTTIIINALGADDSIYHTWKMKGVRAKTIDIDPFGHEGNEYMHIRVTCIYDFYDEE